MPSCRNGFRTVPTAAGSGHRMSLSHRLALLLRSLSCRGIVGECRRVRHRCAFIARQPTALTLPYMGGARTVSAAGIVAYGLLAAGVPPSQAADAQRLACHAPLRAMQQVELLFGRDIGGRIRVSEAAWSHFLAREVTPRFPDGLTVLDSLGQWRDLRGGRGRHGRRGQHGRLVREPGKVVVIVAPDTAKTYDDAAAIVAAYKRLFRQQSVGMITRAVCAGF
jgi:hypothetical protein